MAKPPQDPPVEPQSSGPQEAAPAQDERPTAEEYKSTGTTVVKARKGHEVVPLDTSLPIVGESGVKTSAENAKAVVDTFPDYAYIEEGGE